MRLQSVELRVADVSGVADFFEHLWGLRAAGSNGATRYLRGTAAVPYVIALEPGEPVIRSITFSGSRTEIGNERLVKGPEGVTYRFVVETAVAPLPAEPDRPGCPRRIRRAPTRRNAPSGGAADA